MKRGKRRRIYRRRRYVEKLSTFLESKLGIDRVDIEDRIYGKACLFPHTPFVLQEGIAEKLYAELKMAQKDWPGIEVQAGARRMYPQGKLACDVIGYVGAISSKEYRKISQEIQELQAYLKGHRDGEPLLLPKGFTSPEEVALRLEELEKRSYTIHDQVGKIGVEAAFDEELRGEVGRTLYEVDIEGNLLRSTREEEKLISGKRLILSLSSDLQQEAERLLAQYEHLQDIRDQGGDRIRYHPWQRGGAIVVMDPHTGEILALASHPRFDPNDLVPSKTKAKRSDQASAMIRWLENQAFIGEIWDGKRPIERELYKKGKRCTEETVLTWDLYVEEILDKKTAVYRVVRELDTIEKALSLSPTILAHIPNQRDRLLCKDLFAMVVPAESFSEVLRKEVGSLSIGTFRSYCQTAALCTRRLKKQFRTLFHKRDFRKWREAHFKDFLKKKEKRREKERALCTPLYRLSRKE